MIREKADSMFTRDMMFVRFWDGVGGVSENGDGRRYTYIWRKKCYRNVLC